MAIPITLKEFLAARGAHYDLVPHRRISSSMRAAAVAHVPGDQLAKPVVVTENDHYLMVVVPSSHRVQLGALSKSKHRRYGLATENELTELFPDCEPGAVPALGIAYGMDVVVDPILLDQTDIYFDSGVHEELIHMSSDRFINLLDDTEMIPCSSHC